jgi:hypothetical protein
VWHYLKCNYRNRSQNFHRFLQFLPMAYPRLSSADLLVQLSLAMLILSAYTDFANLEKALACVISIHGAMICCSTPHLCYLIVGTHEMVILK